MQMELNYATLQD